MNKIHGLYTGIVAIIQNKLCPEGGGVGRKHGDSKENPEIPIPINGDPQKSPFKIINDTVKSMKLLSFNSKIGPKMPRPIRIRWALTEVLTRARARARALG